MSEVEKVAVISDLHSNAEALQAVAKDLAAEPPDRLVMLGDLFTYGCEPERMLDALGDMARRFPTTYIVGNHDQLYIDLERGDAAYYASLPAWIRESVDFHVERLRQSTPWRAVPWQLDLVLGRIFLSHANPFGPRDWSYLNGPVELDRARRALERNGHACGVFGHTHRATAYPPDEVALDGSTRSVRHASGWILNPGSVGQPRSAEGRASYLRIAVAHDQAAFDLRPIEYDVAAHLRSIDASSLSDETKGRLRSFFERTHSTPAAP